MGTLNSYVKVNKHPFGWLTSIKYGLEWKLRMSKMPWGKVYRHFWRKRLMKRITEVANEINRRSMRGTRGPISFPYLPGFSESRVATPVGLCVVDNPEVYMVFPKDLV